MAKHASTTRRAVLSAGAALPAVIVTPVIASTTESPGETWRRRRREFIETVAFCHPRGRLVASHAMAMDLDPKDCVGITLVDRSDPGREPELHFHSKARPTVQVVVNAHGAYEHGPVL